MRKILLIGPQGSGKSTQAKLLGEYLKIPVISTGEIFRQTATFDSLIRKILEEGKLVDNQTTSEAVGERLKKTDCQKGFILDGYPRNIDQVRLYDPKFDLVFYLNVSEEEVIKRLTERGRSDDTEELIKRRLDLYYKHTQPLLDYYKNSGVLIEIDGMGDIKKIQDEIKKYL